MDRVEGHDVAKSWVKTLVEVEVLEGEEFERREEAEVEEFGLDGNYDSGFGFEWEFDAMNEEVGLVSGGNEVVEDRHVEVVDLTGRDDADSDGRIEEAKWKRSLLLKLRRICSVEGVCDYRFLVIAEEEAFLCWRRKFILPSLFGAYFGCRNGKGVLYGSCGWVWRKYWR